ncbi:MAG: capsular polysaccharide synthesis protein [Candidatus Azobacteroides sp.]|nr:capsular polysaccharide synthesis protein [Candidatus Azobacteroides sp.]
MKKVLRKIVETVEYFLRKISRKWIQIKMAKKVKKDLLVQAAIAKKLDNYVADFLSGKIERFSAVPKKPELVGKKIIWQFWYQGIDENTPKVVNVCLNSVKKYSNGYEIIILSKENMSDYIELPDFVWKRLGTGGYNITKLSNLVRSYLLSAYGGVWLDATIYLTKPLEESWLQKDFFALQRSETPPADLKIFTKFDPLGLSWEPASYVRMQNSFMIAKPDNKIISDILSILLEYWKKEEETGHYFFYQICFNRMMQHDEWKKLNCEVVCYADFHRFLIVGFDRFSQALYDEVTARWGVHKLTLYWARKKILAGSFVDMIVNEKLKKEEI